MSTHPIPADRLSESDRLGRSAFARVLVRVLRSVDVEEQGAVVAITGAWGSGKSWLLRQAREIDAAEARETKALHWVEFNPWMLGGADALIEAMLVEIAGELALTPTLKATYDKTMKVAETVFSFAETLVKARHLLGAASGVLSAAHPALGAALGGIAGALEATAPVAEKGSAAAAAGKDKAGGKPPEGIRSEGALRGLSLAAARRRVEDALQALDGRLVVVIDDLDRTSPKEIAEVLQAVKAVAAFRKVVYLLAFDPVVVARGLERALNVHDGSAYLEKIVEVPLAMPDPSAMQLRNAGQKMVDDLRHTLGLGPEGEPGGRIEAAAVLMRSPRDVVRWRTLLYTVLPHVAGELDVDDVILVLALQHKAPRVIEYLNDHAEHFFDGPPHEKATPTLRRSRLGQVESADESKGQHRFDELDALVAETGRSADSVRSGLRELRIGEKHRLRLVQPEPLRLWRRTNWLRLRSLTGDSALEGPGDLARFLQRPSTIAESSHAASAEGMRALSARLLPLVGQPRLFAPPEAALDLRGFAAVLAATLARFGDECRTDDDATPWPIQVAESLYVGAAREQQIAILKTFVDAEQQLDTTGTWLRAAVRSPAWRRRPGVHEPIKPSPFDYVLRAWLESAGRYLDDTGREPLSRDSPFDIASRMADLGADEQAIREKVQHALRRAPVTSLARWLRASIAPVAALDLSIDDHPEWPSWAFFRQLVQDRRDLADAAPDLVEALRRLRSDDEMG